MKQFTGQVNIRNKKKPILLIIFTILAMLFIFTIFLEEGLDLIISNPLIPSAIIGLIVMVQIRFAKKRKDIVISAQNMENTVTLYLNDSVLIGKKYFTQKFIYQNIPNISYDDPKGICTVNGECEKLLLEDGNVIRREYIKDPIMFFLKRSDVDEFESIIENQTIKNSYEISTEINENIISESVIFKPSDNRKKEITKKIINNRPDLKRMKITKNIFLPMTAFVPISFIYLILFAFIEIPIKFVPVLLILGTVSFAIGWVSFTNLRYYSGENCNDRRDELLVIEDNILKYGYTEQKYRRPEMIKINNEFDLSKIKKVYYDDLTEKIRVHYSDGEGNLMEFMIYNYFEPSLYDYFRKYI